MSTPIEDRSVWFVSCGVNASTMARTLQAFERAGLRLEPPGTSAASGPGLIFFHGVTSELIDRIRHHSQRGRQRLLAISSGEVRSQDSWRLLASGASDVLQGRSEASLLALVQAKLERWLEIDRLVFSPEVQSQLIGRSPAWLAALRQIVELAHFTESSALILGDDGYRQRADCSSHPCFGRSPQEAGSGGPRLYDHSSGALRKRVLRPQAGCLHQRDCGP